MKKLLMLFFCLATAGPLLAQSTGNLTVTITDIKNPGKGQIFFMLFKQADGFPKDMNKAAYKGTIKQFSNQATYTFENIPYGTYAVSVFQDKNSNGEMDSNLIGMPKEPVGAANQAKMGRPKFKRSAIQLRAPRQAIEIQFIND